MSQRVSVTGVVLTLSLVLVIGLLNNRQASGDLTLTPTPNPYPTSTVPRQDVAASSFKFSYPHLDQLGAWAFVWSAYNGTYPTDYQLIPMLVWRQALPSLATVQSIDLKTSHNYWLVFNECEVIGQCNWPPEDQAEFYHNDVLPLVYDQGGDPDAQLIVGGSMAHECGLAWMTRFVGAYRSLYGEDPPRAGWHFHIYPEQGPASSVWQPGQPCPEESWPGMSYAGMADVNHYVEDAERVRFWWSLYGSPDDEIWITETGCLSNTLCPNTAVHTDMVEYIAAVTAYLNDEGRWINRYGWYVDKNTAWPLTSLMLDPSLPTFTDIGVYYSQVKPSAYEPGFRYLDFQPVVARPASVAQPATPTSTPPAYPPPYP